MMSRILGAPLRGVMRGGQYGLDFCAVSPIRPPKPGGGAGSWLPSIAIVALGDPGVPVICWACVRGVARQRPVAKRPPRIELKRTLVGRTMTSSHRTGKHKRMDGRIVSLVRSYIDLCQTSTTRLDRRCLEKLHGRGAASGILKLHRVCASMRPKNHSLPDIHVSDCVDFLGGEPCVAIFRRPFRWRHS